MKLNRKHIARFFAKVNKADGCWPWVGARSSSGRYGALAVHGKTQGAHRVSWAIHHGPIPDGMHVLHKCDNPICVNPSHLFLGSHLENMADMTSKGRRGKVTPAMIVELKTLIAGGFSIFRASGQVGISRSSAYRLIKVDQKIPVAPPSGNDTTCADS